MWSALRMCAALSARRPGAGAVPGRWGACLAVRTPPAAFIPPARRGRGGLRSLLLPRGRGHLDGDPQQFRRLRPEAAEFLVLGLVLVHPFDALVVPLAGVAF